MQSTGLRNPRPTTDPVDRSWPPGHHHDGSGQAKWSRWSSSSRRHRDHRETRGLEALQRGARPRGESRSTL